MATADSANSPEGPVSLDDGGLRAKLDLHPVSDGSAVTPGDLPQTTDKAPGGIAPVLTAAPADSTQYSSTQCTASSLPPGGAAAATHIAAHHPGVTCTGAGTRGVTEAKGNPTGLERHPAGREPASGHSMEEPTGEEGGIRKPTEQNTEVQTLSDEEDSNGSGARELGAAVAGGRTQIHTFCVGSEERRSRDTTGGRSEDSGSALAPGGTSFIQSDAAEGRPAERDKREDSNRPVSVAEESRTEGEDEGDPSRSERRGRELEEPTQRNTPRLSTRSSADLQTGLVPPSAEREHGEERGEGGGTIADVIQQGEQLLRRLRWVQERQDARRAAEKPSPAASAKPQREADIPGDDRSDGGASASTEIREIDRRQRSLRRAGGLFDVAEDPDVLEIPFKTDILLTALRGEPGPRRHPDRQLSEQKMQEEIGLEIQREVVLGNQGTVPGEYSRGASRHLKETKRLFEGLREGNAEGLARPSEPLSSLFKDPVYPSVPECRRSLEMPSRRTHPACRTQTHGVPGHVAAERKRWAEGVRSKSPSGGPRDGGARLSPYPTHDKDHLLHRSMDSLGLHARAGEVAERRRREPARPSENPFCKLRPALAQQPGVQRDIWEAEEREEELRLQRRSLYGESGEDRRREGPTAPARTLGEAGEPPLDVSPDGTFVGSTVTLDARQQSMGKLDRIWPPPPKKGHLSSGHAQEAQTHLPGGQMAALWQRWENTTLTRVTPQAKN